MRTWLNERTVVLDLLEIHAYTKRSGATVFTLSGDIDISNHRQVQDVLLRESGGAAHDIICDLAKVAFIDSSGLRMLISLQHQAIKNGNTMRLNLGENARLKRLLDLSGLDRVFTFVPAIVA